MGIFTHRRPWRSVPFCRRRGPSGSVEVIASNASAQMAMRTIKFARKRRGSSFEFYCDLFRGKLGLMSPLLPSPYLAGKVRSAGFAGFAHQGLYFALASQIAHFLKGAIWPHVGRENIVVDADRRVGPVRAST
jgi:hypothetical protein